MSSDYSNVQPQPQTRKGMAIASLVLGIISIPTMGLFVVGAITAIVLGVIALGKIKKEPATYSGKGMAIAGIITSSVSLLLIAVFGLLAAIAVPKLVASIKQQREATTIESLRTIHNNQAIFITAHSRFATLNELAEAGLLNQSYASGGTVSGYVYSSSDVSKETYCVRAVRTSSTVANRDFIVCEDGIIRYVESKIPSLIKRGEGSSVQ
jgi:type II secretory pathway pseudopilin PulG